jgi:hypothetical protein
VRLAYSLGNFLRTLATPEPIKDWSLTSLENQDRREGGEPRPLCDLPNGRGRHRMGNVPRDIAAHCGVTAAAITTASVRRSMSCIQEQPTKGVRLKCQGKAGVLPRALAIASFLVYATTIFALPQVRNSEFCCELSSFAAAVSNIVYGSRIGSMYTGVFDIFLTHLREPLPQKLKEISAELPARPPGGLSATTIDGNGVGYPIVATVAFRLFGFHWWAPAAVMLLLMAASMTAFLNRFPPLLVTLYFCGLTLMLFTVLVWDPAWRIQISVGGIRYFSVVGLLPLFYILLSLMEWRPSRATVSLVVQAAILTLASLTRGNAVTGFGAILLVGLLLARRRSVVVRPLVTVGVTSAALVIALALVVSPQWVKTGRFHTIIWTRVTQSLGMNPRLPIADLNKMYPCQKYVPEGIPPGIGDQGSGCIWLAYVIEHDIPAASLWDKTFNGEFEAVLRNAFFRIAFKYPWETLETFVYYKPKAIIDSIKTSLQFNLPDTPLSIVLLLASLGIALVAAATAVEFYREAAVVLVSALFTTTAYLATYANAATTGDLLLLCLMALGLALCAIAAGVRAAMRRLSF